MSDGWDVTVDGVTVSVHPSVRQGRLVGLTADCGPTGTQMDSLLKQVCKAVSVGLQRGVPIEAYTRALRLHKCEPCGPTTDPLVPECTSLVDAVFAGLAKRFGSEQGAAG